MAMQLPGLFLHSPTLHTPIWASKSQAPRFTAGKTALSPRSKEQGTSWLGTSSRGGMDTAVRMQPLCPTWT